jgi:hypothetical protein
LPEKAQGAGDWFCGSAIGPHGLILFSALALVAAGAAGAAEPVVYALAGTVITCEACGAGGDGGGSAALPHAGIGPFPVVSAQVGHTARFRWADEIPMPGGDITLDLAMGPGKCVELPCAECIVMNKFRRHRNISAPVREAS